jgi:hypothetical protein
MLRASAPHQAFAPLTGPILGFGFRSATGQAGGSAAPENALRERRRKRRRWQHAQFFTFIHFYKCQIHSLAPSASKVCLVPVFAMQHKRGTERR